MQKYKTILKVVTRIWPGESENIQKDSKNVLFLKKVLLLHKNEANGMKRVLLFFLLLCAAVSVQARQYPFAYIPITVRDGLSHPNVTALCQDSRGSLWIGTKNGLNRFDHRRVRMYSSRIDDLSSLPDKLINALFEGSGGDLWVLCESGVVRYLPEEDAFRTVLPFLCLSAAEQDGTLYFGSSGKLFGICGGESSPQILHPFPGGEDQRDYDIVCMTALSGGDLLLGTRTRGIFRYTPGGTATLFAPAPEHSLIAMYRCEDGSVCVSGYGCGFRLYDPEGRLTGNYTSGNSGLSSNYIQAFMEYRGELWIATDGGGISIFSPEKRAFRTLRRLSGDPDTPPSNSITTLYKDTFGTLWAGTVKDGVFQIRDNYIRELKGHARGLNDNAVISLFREEDSTLWVGTDGGGIHKLNASEGRFTRLNGSEGKILSIAGFDRRRLLVSVYMDGYYLVDGTTGHRTPFVLVDKETDLREKYSGSLLRAMQLPWGTLCFLGGDSWLYHHGKGFSPMRMEGDAPAPHGLQIACAGAERALLYKDNHVFELRRSDEKLRLCFSVGLHEKVTAIADDGAGNVWVGTSRCLGCFRESSGRYETISNSQFDDVSALECSGKEQLWICARNRLFTYFPREGRFVSWGASDGYYPNGIKMLYQNALSDHYLYMGGSEGVVQVDRRIPIPSSGEPQFFLEHLQVNGQAAETRQGRLTIPWNKRQVSASFLVKKADLFQPDFFRYRVEGSRSWTYESDEPRLSLSALAPGDYTLWVSCRTKGGSFSSPQRMLSLTVLPPWYKTSWFAMVCSLLVAVLLLLTVRYILRRRQSESKNAMAHFLEEMLQEEEPREEDGDENPLCPDPDFRNKLDKLIMENLSDPDLGIKFLTDRLPLSRSSLYAKVKEVTGMGVKDYINRMRIERSVQLLMTTDKTINEIAYEVGFTYPRYFSTSFKSFKGVTPTSFKKENRHE